MAVTVTQLEGLYLAYFGRPADADGLAFYLSNPNTDIWAVAKAFSESPESQALYGATFNSGVINAIYENLFNRAAESSGVSYWSGEVSAGRLSAAGAAFGIFLGAQNADLTTVNNKLAVCAAFTTAMDTAQEKAAYSGNAAAAMARSFIAAVDSSAASKAAGLAEPDQEVAALVSAATVNASNEVIANAAIASGATNAVTADHPNFLAANGIVDNGYAYLTGLQSGASVEVSGGAGNYTNLIMSANADGQSDVLNLKVNPYVLDDNDPYAEIAGFHNLSFNVGGVEHLNLDVTATVSTTANRVAGWQADYPLMSVGVAGQQLQSVIVTGNEAFELGLFSPGVTVIDAVAFAPTAGTVYSSYTGRLDFGFIYHADNTAPALVVRGSATTANELFGTNWDNTLIGGSKDDVLRGGAGADTLTGGAGNDRFQYEWTSDSDFVGNAAPIDTITDFSPNTIGLDAGGTPGPHGAFPDRGLRNGDLIDLTNYGKSTISLGIAGSADGAATIVKQLHDTWGNDVNAALDSTTGMLYLDTNGDGVVDTKIELLGVKTLTTAAFLLAPGN